MKISQNTQAKFGQWLVTAVLGFGWLLLLAESAMYSGFVAKNLLIDPYLTAAILLLTAFTLNLKLHWQPLSIFKTTNSLGFLPLVLIGFVFSVWLQAETYIHIVYTHLHLDIYLVVWLWVYAWLCAVLFPIKKRWFYRFLFFMLGIFISAYGVLLRQKGYYYFRDVVVGMGQDGAIVENIQFYLYFLSSLFAGFSALYMKKHNFPWWLVTAYILAAIGFVFIAGEEISWGQRILGLETPEYLKETNLQQEINLHNNQQIFGYVYRAYLALSFYCSVAWLGMKLVTRFISTKLRSQFKLFIPAGCLISFFLPSFIYFYLHRARHLPLQEYEEYAELVLAAGLFIFFVKNWLYLHSEFKHKLLSILRPAKSAQS